MNQLLAARKEVNTMERPAFLGKIGTSTCYRCGDSINGNVEPEMATLCWRCVDLMVQVVERREGRLSDAMKSTPKSRQNRPGRAILAKTTETV